MREKSSLGGGRREGRGEGGREEGGKRRGREGGRVIRKKGGREGRREGGVNILTFFNTLLHSDERAQLVNSEKEAVSTSARGLPILAATQLRWLVRQWEVWLTTLYSKLSVPRELTARAD